MIYERKPNRLKGYDYSKDNLYFVTSCVHDRICCFGEIVWTDLGEINVVGTGRDLSQRQMILKLPNANGIGWPNNIHMLFCTHLWSCQIISMGLSKLTIRGLYGQVATCPYIIRKK